MTCHPATCQGTISAPAPPADSSPPTTQLAAPVNPPPPSRVREGNRGPWLNAYCVIKCHQVHVYRTDGSAEPGPEAQPSLKLELVGAHLAAHKGAELTLSVPKRGTFTLQAGSPEERDEWMVGLGKVPGLFR